MIEQSLNDFWRYLKYEKRFSQHTLNAYQQDLTQFSKFIKDSFDVSDAIQVQHFHVRSWLASLKDNDGNTAADWAVRNKRAEVVQVLKRKR